MHWSWVPLVYIASLCYLSTEKSFEILTLNISPCIQHTDFWSIQSWCTSWKGILVIKKEPLGSELYLNLDPISTTNNLSLYSGPWLRLSLAIYTSRVCYSFSHLCNQVSWPPIQIPATTYTGFMQVFWILSKPYNKEWVSSLLFNIVLRSVRQCN